MDETSSYCGKRHRRTEGRENILVARYKRKAEKLTKTAIAWAMLFNLFIKQRLFYQSASITLPIEFAVSIIARVCSKAPGTASNRG